MYVRYKQNYINLQQNLDLVSSLHTMDLISTPQYQPFIRDESFLIILGKVGNQDKLLGVLKHKSHNLRSTRNPVTGADRVGRNL